MDPWHRRRKRRIMEDRIGPLSPSLLPEWLMASFRTRSIKLRMRIVICLVTCFLVIYVVVSRGGPVASSNGGNENVLHERQRWRISENTRRKPVAIDQITDAQAHAPRLMTPPRAGSDRRHVPPGFVGVGGGNKVLQPPPGPALAGHRSRMGLEDHPNPRMRIPDGSPGGDKGAGGGGPGEGGVVGSMRRGVHNVGPPGQSNAMHLVEGGENVNNYQDKPQEGVLVAPKVNRLTSGETGSRINLPLAGGYPDIQGGNIYKSATDKNHLSYYVHLDLKVGPPKVSYLNQIFPLLKRLGASGVILDYGENFPYRGVVAALASSSGYTATGIQAIVTAAKASHLDIIPLVQTFSNVEFILKHPQFRYLQERPNYLQNLNPARNETSYLVGRMLDQVLESHPGVRYVHVGCEEVYHLGYSPESRAFLAASPKNKMADLYLHHVTNVAKLVRSRHPDVRVILWDSVVRSINVNVLKRHHLGSLVEPMISLSSLEVALSADIVQKYAATFSYVWVATTFNKPTPNIALLPSIQRYITHHRSWIEKLTAMQSSLQIRAVALVGNYRVNYFSPVAAVLLPVALPSLGLCLRTLTRGEFDQTVKDDVTSALECGQQQRPYLEDDVWSSFSWCSFPGSALFVDFVEVRENVLHMKRIINSEGQNDVSPIVRKFEEILTRLPRHIVLIYDRHIAKEWLEYHIVNNLSSLGGFKTKAKTMIASNQWLKASRPN